MQLKEIVGHFPTVMLGDLPGTLRLLIGSPTFNEIPM